MKGTQKGKSKNQKVKNREIEKSKNTKIENREIEKIKKLNKNRKSLFLKLICILNIL